MLSLNNPYASDSTSSGIITEKFLTVQVACQLTGYNSQYLRRLLRQGKLEGVHVGQAWLIQLDSLFAYLKRVGSTPDQRFGSKKRPNSQVYSTVDSLCLQTYTVTNEENMT